MSFLHKDKFKNPKANKARDFKAKITWIDTTDTGNINLNNEFNSLQEERIKYIPQNYLEKLCVNEEQKEFEEDLKKIIFAHIPLSNKLGQNSLDDLIEEKQRSIEEGISNLKVNLSRINKLISRLELKNKPSYKTALLQQIAEKEAELNHHTNNKPKEKLKPDEDENQKAINSAIIQDLELKQSAIKLMTDQKSALESELTLNNISINELSGVSAEASQVGGTIQKFLNEKKIILTKYEIAIDNTISYKIDTKEITDKINLLKERNTTIDSAINGKDETSGLVQQISDAKAGVVVLQNQLAESQKEYHQFLQDKEVWEKRRDYRNY